jgi:hypothetical protein
MADDKNEIWLENKKKEVKGVVPKKWIEDVAGEVGLNPIPRIEAYYVADIDLAATYHPTKKSPWVVVIPDEEKGSREIKRSLRHELSHIKSGHSQGYKNAKDMVYKELQADLMWRRGMKGMVVQFAALTNIVAREYNMSRDKAWEVVKDAAKKLGCSEKLISTGHRALIYLEETGYYEKA